MRRVTVQTGKSLMDISLMYYDTLEMLQEIAEVNSLPMDYTFSESRMIELPVGVEKERAEDMNTGLEGENSWVWLLEKGRWDDRALWVDYNWWKG